jgi:hypothetical protein
VPLCNAGTTVTDVPVTPLRSKLRVVKFTFAATCTRYATAPSVAFQPNGGVVETPVALSEGNVNIGIKGGATIVVKVRTDDHSLTPPALTARTRQKY